MTREEAVDYIKEWLKDEYALNNKDRIVLTMAIEALLQDDNGLYIKIYANDEPSRKVEKLYQICDETESQEVTQWLKEYFPFADRPIGEWINRERCQVDEDAYEVATCSECGAEITIEYPHDSYCPNCGVKMLNINYKKFIETGE